VTHRGLSRRHLLRLGPAVALGGLAAGCSQVADPTAGRYRHGELTIGTGNTTGVFYEIGAGYADVISRNLPGYRAEATPTAGSVDNLKRLGTGDIDIALVIADNAADAAAGNDAFSGAAVALRALARIYSNDLHVVVRADAHVDGIADLRGHRVSTGPAGSGTAVVAARALAAAGLDPTRDVTTVAASLPEATAALAARTIDALMWSGGLPTPGITDLFAKAGAQVRFLPADGLVPALRQRYGADIYATAVIPAATYGTGRDVPTLAQPNLVVVRPDLPDELTYQLTKLLFDHQADLVTIHSAAKDINRETGPKTAPLQLAPGAARFYQSG
jgi:TRAP transporter TAXI family solute receptor